MNRRDFMRSTMGGGLGSKVVGLPMTDRSAKIVQKMAAWSLVLYGVFTLYSSVHWSRENFDVSPFGIALGVAPIVIGNGVMGGSDTSARVGIGCMTLLVVLGGFMVLITIFGPLETKWGRTSANTTPARAACLFAWSLATIALLRAWQLHKK